MNRLLARLVALVVLLFVVSQATAAEYSNLSVVKTKIDKVDSGADCDVFHFTLSKMDASLVGKVVKVSEIAILKNTQGTGDSVYYIDWKNDWTTVSSVAIYPREIDSPGSECFLLENHPIADIPTTEENGIVLSGGESAVTVDSKWQQLDVGCVILNADTTYVFKLNTPRQTLFYAGDESDESATRAYNGSTYKGEPAIRITGEVLDAIVVGKDESLNLVNLNPVFEGPITISEGGVLNLTADNNSYPAQSPLVLANKILNNGELKTQGFITLDNESNQTLGTLNVVSGVLTMKAQAGAGTGFNGIVKVAAGAELKPQGDYSMSVSSGTTVDIHGTLTLDCIWTLDPQVAFNFYPGAVVQGTTWNVNANGKFNFIKEEGKDVPVAFTSSWRSNEPILNVESGASVAVNQCLTKLAGAGKVIYETAWEDNAGKKDLTVPEGMTVVLAHPGSGAGDFVWPHANNNTSTIFLNDGSVLELESGLAFVTIANAEEATTGKTVVTGAFTLGTGGSEGDILTHLEVPEQKILSIRAFSNENITPASLMLAGTIKADDVGGTVDPKITIPATGVLSGSGAFAANTSDTHHVRLVLAAGATVDTTDGVPTVSKNVSADGLVKVKLEEGSNPSGRKILNGETTLAPVAGFPVQVFVGDVATGAGGWISRRTNDGVYLRRKGFMFMVK